jgi:glutamyl-tRNA reductase
VSGRSGEILALVTHARQVPALERQRFVERLRADPGGRTFIVETCHRVEGYAAATAGDPEQVAQLASLPAGGRSLRGEPAIRHAIAVAVGRDSVVVGEDQILHQLRTSVDEARAAGTLDPELERLFALGLRAGRRARSWRQGPALSLADLAVSMIERQAGSVRGRHVLVVGVGRMGRLAVAAAVARGASVALANRSAGGASALAATTGARVEAFDPGDGIGQFAGVIVALGGPWPLAARTTDALAGSATVVVDLSVPAAVPMAAVERLGSRLVTADALAVDESQAAGRGDATIARLDALIDRTTTEFLAWQDGADGRATAAALIRRADREREVELEALWRLLPDLQPEQRDAIEGMTRHLASRLLREPLERLGRDAEGRDERAVRDIFAL